MSKGARPASAIAFAPATVANVAVGFDLLGFAMGQAGDKVRATRIPEPGAARSRASGSGPVTIRAITGLAQELPSDPRKNTASVAVLKLLELSGARHGFELEIEKGIPLGSGMGGSAASAVGAVIAANALLDEPLGRERLLECALAGEAVASGSAHADNVAPCLYGGLTLAFSTAPLRVVPLPVPERIRCALVHPDLKVETQAARALLKPQILLSEHVRQSANLAGFLAACFSADLELLGRAMADLIVEPQRAALIPGFHEAKARALETGALGFSISGSGPSVFAWTEGDPAARRIADAVAAEFRKQGLACDSWVGPISREGARVVG